MLSLSLSLEGTLHTIPLETSRSTSHCVFPICGGHQVHKVANEHNALQNPHLFANWCTRVAAVMKQFWKLIIIDLQPHNL